MFANPLGIPPLGGSQQNASSLPSFAPPQAVQPTVGAMPSDVLQGLAQNGMSRYPQSAMGLAPQPMMAPIQFVQAPGGVPPGTLATQPAKKKKSVVWIYVVVGLGVVAVLAVVTTLVLKQKKKPSEGEEDEEEESNEETDGQAPSMPSNVTPRKRPMTADEKKRAMALEASRHEGRMRTSGVNDRTADEGDMREPRPASRDAGRGGANINDAFTPMDATEMLEEMGELEPLERPDVDASGRPLRDSRRGRRGQGRGRGRGGYRRSRDDDPLFQYDDEYDDEDDIDDYDDYDDRGKRGGGHRRRSSLAEDMFDEGGADMFADRKAGGGGGRRRKNDYRKMGRTRDGYEVYGGDRDDQYATYLD